MKDPQEKEEDSQGPQLKEGTDRDRDVWGGSQEGSSEETMPVDEMEDSESQEREFQESKLEDSIFLARNEKRNFKRSCEREGNVKFPENFLHKRCVSQNTYKRKRESNVMYKIYT